MQIYKQAIIALQKIYYGRSSKRKFVTTNYIDVIKDKYDSMVISIN